MALSRFFTRTHGLSRLSDLLAQPDLDHDYWQDGRWVWDSDFNGGGSMLTQIRMGLRDDAPVQQVGKPGVDGLICYVKGGDNA